MKYRLVTLAMLFCFIQLLPSCYNEKVGTVVTPVNLKEEGTLVEVRPVAMPSETARHLWDAKAPTAYSYLLSSSTDKWYFYLVRVTVNGEKIWIDIQSKRPDDLKINSKIRVILIDDLFSFIKGCEAEYYEVTFDETYGFPVSFEYRNLELTDSIKTFFISEFYLLDASDF